MKFKLGNVNIYHLRRACNKRVFKKGNLQIENQKPHQKFPLYGKKKVLQLYLQHPLMECGSDQSSPSQQPSHNKLEYMYTYKF